MTLRENRKARGLTLAAEARRLNVTVAYLLERECIEEVETAIYPALSENTETTIRNKRIAVLNCMRRRLSIEKRMIVTLMADCSELEQQIQILEKIDG